MAALAIVSPTLRVDLIQFGVYLIIVICFTFLIGIFCLLQVFRSFCLYLKSSLNNINKSRHLASYLVYRTEGVVRR